MKTKITDIYKDYLEIEAESETGLGITACAPQSNRKIGFVFNAEEVEKLRDACNAFLGETSPRPISFGAGGNTVIIVNEEVSPFSVVEAEALKKLISGIIKK